MNIRHSVAFAVTLALGSASALAGAASGTPFSYHGSLMQHGAAANGAYDFEFALYDAPTGGAALDVSSVPNVAVSRGSINATFQFEHTSAHPGEQWVEVRVRTAGTTGVFETVGSRSVLNGGSNVKTIAGPAGIGQTYDAEFTPNLLIGDATVLLGNVNVPAGSYVAIVRMQMQTGDEANPGNNYRPDCALGPNIENTTYRVGEESSVERYLTWQGATTLASDGAIQFSCRDGNGHTDTELSGKLTVMSVGSVAQGM
jgi:hypothetical protein